MADLFTLLASQVLGSQPELRPLLPPRFAAWPDSPPASPLIQPWEPVDEPTGADMPLFPPPLIDPGHPAVDTPLPSLRQLSQVGTGPGPSIQPELAPVPQAMSETSEAEPGDIQQDAAPPLVPAPPGSRPEPATATPPPDVGQTRQPLPAPPTQPVVQEGDGSATGVAPGLASQPADAPVTPLVPDPALEPAAAPEPAPVLQRASQAQPGDIVPLGYSSPGPARPADNLPPSAEGPPAATGDQAAAAQEGRAVDAPITPLVPEPAQEPAPVLQGADPAQGHQAPLIGPPKRAAPYQPGDIVPLGYFSPGPASPPADAPVTPLVPDPALEPRAPAGPPAALGASPDRPTKNSPGAPSPRAATAQGHQAPSISPPKRAAPYQPGDIVPLGYSSPGKARPTESLPPSAEGRPAATRNQKAAGQEGRWVDAPPAQPSPRVEPPGEPGAPLVPRNAYMRADSRSWPGPAEPTIVPAPEPRPGKMWSTPRAEAARPTVSTPEPPPTVRVTIGRVVVRAGPADERPPSRRVELPRPALSLDDYLEAMKGGEP